jgi:hypothetical protein
MTQVVIQKIAAGPAFVYDVNDIVDVNATDLARFTANTDAERPTNGKVTAVLLPSTDPRFGHPTKKGT